MSWIDVSVCAAHPKAAVDPQALLATMDEAGVARAWLFGAEVATTHDFAAANARVLDLAERHPDRFVPIGVVNPFEASVEAPRLLARGMKGIKVLTNWGNWISLNNVREFIVPLGHLLTDARLPLIIALEGVSPLTGGSVSLPLIVRRACPKLCLVLDHCWSPLAWEDYLAFAREYPDVWITLHGLPQMLLRRAIEELGPDRILLGSWYPETDPDLVYLQVERASGLGARLGDMLTANAERALAGRRPGRA
jgi:uncharacterized protein